MSHVTCWIDIRKDGYVYILVAGADIGSYGDGHGDGRRGRACGCMLFIGSVLSHLAYSVLSHLFHIPHHHHHPPTAPTTITTI